MRENINRAGVRGSDYNGVIILYFIKNGNLAGRVWSKIKRASFRETRDVMGFVRFADGRENMLVCPFKLHGGTKRRESRSISPANMEIKFRWIFRPFVACVCRDPVEIESACFSIFKLDDKRVMSSEINTPRNVLQKCFCGPNVIRAMRHRDTQFCAGIVLDRDPRSFEKAVPRVKRDLRRLNLLVNFRQLDRLFHRRCRLRRFRSNDLVIWKKFIAA